MVHTFDGAAFDGAAFDGAAFDGAAFDGTAIDGVTWSSDRRGSARRNNKMIHLHSRRATTGVMCMFLGQERGKRGNSRVTTRITRKFI